MLNVNHCLFVVSDGSVCRNRMFTFSHCEDM